MSKRVILAEKQLTPVASKALTNLERSEEWKTALTAKEFRFVEEYLIDCNPTLAGIRAGLGSTPSSAANAASIYLKRRVVCRAIWEATQSVLGDSLKATVMHQLAAIAFANSDDYMSWDKNGKVTFTPSAELTRHQKAAIKGIKRTTGKVSSVEFILHDSQAALNQLMKLLAMARTAEDGPRVAIQINFSDEDKAVL